MSNKKKSYTNNILKVMSLCITFFIVGISFTLYSNWKYKNYINTLYQEFNSHNYTQAYSIYSNNLSKIPFKNETLNSDLSNYFTNVVSTVCDALDSNDITKKDALEILNEIGKYNLFNTSLQKLTYSIEGKDSRFLGTDEELFSQAEVCINEKKYSEAIEYLNNISPNYSNAQAVNSLIDKCKNNYKTELLKASDNLAANKYYTKAINLLNDADKNLINANDQDIINKLTFYEMIKEEYLAYRNEEDAEYTSTAILEPISQKNINTLDIESKTPYIVYVNIDEQKTYIYEGEKNNWNLLKVFSCSTGLPGKETPKGVFDVDGRGDWFFSEEFNQGGKYYVQFLGDYLFHSLPYDRDGATVVDNTLGVPSSHGCIRLKESDAKWIYDNITNDTKVIIN